MKKITNDKTKINFKLFENVKISKNIIMIMIAIISSLLILLGTSYAVFNMIIISNKEHTITSGNLTITFLETSQFIALNNAYPMTDSEGLGTKSYNIKITNTGTVNVKYRIKLEDDATIKNIVSKNALKISYKEGTGNYSTPCLMSSLESESVIVKDKILNVGENATYEFKIWLDINATNNEQGKSYRSKIVVESVQNLVDYIDTLAPIIKLNGELNTNVSKGATFTDAGVLSVADDKDKTLTTSNVVKTYEYFNGTTTTTVSNVNTANLGVYFIYYKIKDISNNEGITVRTVSVNDNTPPTILLTGNAVMELSEGSQYVEPGFTATSSSGENITNHVVVIGSINQNSRTTQIIKYIAVDKNNHMSSMTRTVNVVEVTFISQAFAYTGAYETFTVPKTGTYIIEVWGASGGFRSSNAYAGKGGYAKGEVSLTKGDILYAYIGGTGDATSKGYNGGGLPSYTNVYGGGATDFRYVANANFADLASLNSRIIVAGGGGTPGAAAKMGMYGGGEVGGSTSESYGTGGGGGTQTAGGTGSGSATGKGTAGTYGDFGIGGRGYSASNGYAGAGGGGWFGGAGSYPDGSGDDDRGGGGGSGYVLTASSARPSGYNPLSKYYFTNTQLLGGNITTIPTLDGTGVMTGNLGNGYAKITLKIN